MRYLSAISSQCLFLLACFATIAPAPLRADAEIPAAPITSEQPADAFSAWLAEFREQARLRGISQGTLDTALSGLRPIERVLEYDRRQPEFIDTFLNYLNSRVNDKRVATGKEMLAIHDALLGEVAQRYGVPARYLVAFWGLETNYGSHLGDFPVIAALATLAFDSRRAGFFREQLLAALRIIDQGHAAPETLLGSWAGAMGQMQFIPGTFLRHAVDADADGRKDLWRSLPDALNSAANYLKHAGWRSDEGWGQEVLLPGDFNWRLADLAIRKPINAWAALGVRQANGEPLPNGDRNAALILPQGHGGPAFLVQPNFEVILDWNRSVNYAVAVGILADRLIGMPPLSHGLDADNRRLSREEAVELQRNLAVLGFDPGQADGIPGTRTRAAIRAYQIAAGLPADGQPSLPLLERLQAEASAKTIAAPESHPPEPAAGPIRTPAMETSEIAS